MDHSEELVVVPASPPLPASSNWTEEPMIDPPNTEMQGTRMYPVRLSPSRRTSRVPSGRVAGMCRVHGSMWSCISCSATAQPRSLHPCGHSLCVQCLERLEATGEPPVKKCPICRQHIRSTAVNYALTGIDQNTPGTIQNVQNVISASLGWKSTKKDQLCLLYSAFIATLVEKAKNQPGMVLKVVYTWQMLETCLKSEKIEIPPLLHLNVHQLFVQSIETMSLPEAHTHTCVALDTYELEILVT